MITEKLSPGWYEDPVIPCQGFIHYVGGGSRFRIGLYRASRNPRSAQYQKWHLVLKRNETTIVWGNKTEILKYLEQRTKGGWLAESVIPNVKKVLDTIPPEIEKDIITGNEDG